MTLPCAIVSESNSKLYKLFDKYVLQEKNLDYFGLTIKYNDQGKRELPKVQRSDSMSIKPPKDKIENTNNKCFHTKLTIDNDIFPYNPQILTDECSTQFIESPQFRSYDYIDNELFVENQLRNPSEKNPMSIAEFLGEYLDISGLQHIFDKRYGTVTYHYRYPLDAMIKSSMIRRIKCLRSFQKLVNRFETQSTDANSIGFQNNGNGTYQIPDRRTFRHWENVRVDNTILEEVMNLFVVSLRIGLEKQGIILGRRIGIDSTPLESFFNDADAKYNGHYEKTGYKIHNAVCLDTNLPLAIIITPMNEADSNYFIQLLSKLDELGIKFNQVFADGAYDTFEHFALVHQKYNAMFYTNPSINSVYHEKGTAEGIQHEYNKYWKNDDYVLPNKITLLEKMEYLMKQGKSELVGAYYRNQYLQNWEKDEIKKKRGGHSDYNQRNACEGFHGYAKQWLNLQYYFDYRGIKNVERHVRWTYLAVLGVALARVQNGITEDLTQIAFFE